jgi:hypothetical protein
MEASRVIPLPGSRLVPGRLAGDLRSAIELVAAGAARRVVLAGIPGIEEIAPEALAWAQGAHVAFRLVRSPGALPTAIVGPLEA